MITRAASDWSEDNAMRLSAALAYYSIFSLAPLLIITISMVGLFYGEAAAKGQIAGQMKELAGGRAADAIQALVVATSRKSASVSATIIGLVLLLFGASGVFSELKSALNTIWGVAVKPGSAISTMIRERVISFTMVLGVGFLLLVSLLLSAALAATSAFLKNVVPIDPMLWQVVDLVVSFGIVTLLFAMIFKVLPNVVLGWGDVWIGGAVTAFLFTVGKVIIGFYLGTSSVTSYYGAAGSAIVLLLWVYYSACILFFGAEFTKAFVRRNGSLVMPDRRGILLSDLLKIKDPADKDLRYADASGHEKK